MSNVYDLRARVVKFIKDSDWQQFHKGNRKELRVNVSAGKDFEDQPIETEEMSPQWFNLSNIPYDKMWPDDQYWLPKILNNKKVRTRFSLDDNDKIVEHTIEEVIQL